MVGLPPTLDGLAVRMAWPVDDRRSEPDVGRSPMG